MCGNNLDELFDQRVAARRACALDERWSGAGATVRTMTETSHLTIAEHAPHNAMEDRDEIARFYDRGSDLMRELLCELARVPGEARPLAQIEDALGWPHRRIASVLGGVGRVRQVEFAGRRPYRFHDTHQGASGRWEMFMDARQARALQQARAEEARRG
jgi:hypothetical protein